MAFSLQNFIRTTQTRDGSPRFVITLSAPASALIAAILIVIVAWCFFMGFMVGRGQNPEKHLEEIAAIVGQTKDDESAASRPEIRTGRTRRRRTKPSPAPRLPLTGSRPRMPETSSPLTPPLPMPVLAPRHP